MASMPTHSKTAQQKFVERALLIWTVGETLELARKALLLVLLLRVVVQIVMMPL
jgi:hypothetical protein